MIVEERKNGLGKGGKYLQKENILFYGGKEKLRGKMRKIFEEGKYFSVEEKEKEGNIWRGKISGQWRRRKRRKIFGEGKNILLWKENQRQPTTG